MVVTSNNMFPAGPGVACRKYFFPSLYKQLIRACYEGMFDCYSKDAMMVCDGASHAEPKPLQPIQTLTPSKTILNRSKPIRTLP